MHEMVLEQSYQRKIVEWYNRCVSLKRILNFGLEGLKRLRTNGWHFSYGEEESGEMYRRASNPLVAFLEDMCVPSDDYVVKAELVKAFNEYAREKRLPPATSNKAFARTNDYSGGDKAS